jgi:hypothetical protein
VPHLRDGFIVVKMGIREAIRSPPSFRAIGPSPKHRLLRLTH